MIDSNLDPLVPTHGVVGSNGIAAYSEEEFLAGGREEFAELAGAQWWATMRLVGPEALYRSAARLAQGTRPTMRELLLDLKIPRTYLHPEADGPVPGTAALTEAGVTVVPIPACGHNIMLDNPEAFAHATADALAD